MLKTKLPVIVLRNMILLPHGELKLELSSETDKGIITKSSNEYDNYILLVSPECITDENLNVDDLPLIGTIGKIVSNFELPNGNIRISIIGVNRAKIFEYIEEGNLNSIIGPLFIEENDKIIEEANNRKLKKEFSSYVSIMPNISNGLINKISDEESLEKLTDVIVNMLPLKFDKKINYIKEPNCIKRSNMLMNDLEEEKKINLIDKDIDSKLKIQLDKTNREFFLKEKIKIIKEELGEDISKDEEINEIKEKIDALDASEEIKNKLYKELKKYQNMQITSPEISIVKNYIDTVLSLPFGILTKDNVNLKKIEKSLDETHFGLEKIKDRIIEYRAVKQLSKSLKSPILCLVGPPGVGKTSLAFSIAKSLNRKFVKISVGGISDEAEIIGHRRTYIGASPGRIINGIRKANTMNPVFLIDEIDKMKNDIKGDPASALLEVLDPEQNKLFYDNYIEEPFDLSNVMFILTANNIEDIPYALRDRLEIIRLSSYTIFEKLAIINTHMYNNLLKEHGLTKNNIVIDDEVLKYIINYYTMESGVRELERVLSSIMRKVVKDIVKTGKRTKHIITIENIEDYLGNKKFMGIDSKINKNYGVVNGLAYTNYGGSILPIEAIIYKGKGNVVMTGSLGEVMKESAEIALGYVKSHCKELEIDEKLLEKSDIHINAIEGSIPKNGPSAGVALVSVIISSLTKKVISNKIAMTGEVTLHGDILAIGGLKEKSIGAFNAGIEKIFIPKSNESDLDSIPNEIKDKFEIILVDNYIDIFKNIF